MLEKEDFTAFTEHALSGNSVFLFELREVVGFVRRVAGVVFSGLADSPEF